MIKNKKIQKLRTLELKKETVLCLRDDQLEHVIGGAKTTRLSQCPTLCFTL